MKISYWFILFLFAITKFISPSFAMEISDEEWLKDRKIRILAADDNTSTRLILQRTLLNICDIQLVKNGNELLSTFEPSRFDLVLTDGNMPKMDGYEASRQLSRKYPDILIIAVTSDNGTTDKEKFRKAGVKTVVPKPIIKENLLSAIRTVLSEKSDD